MQLKRALCGRVIDCRHIVISHGNSDCRCRRLAEPMKSLIRADLVTGEVGRGSFVKARLRETMTTPWHKSTRIQPKYDLSLMTPVALAQINEAWSETLHRIAGRLDETVIYGFRPRQTASRYANMAAAWLGRCGLVVGTGRILVTNGMTPAMHVALATVASPGDVIATETLTSHTLRPTAKSLQLQLRGIACDDRGMCPDALVEAAKDAGGQMKAVVLASVRCRTMRPDRRCGSTGGPRRCGGLAGACDSRM